MSIQSSRLVQLSPAQHEVLSAAAQRPRCAVILPARLKGQAAYALAKALLDKGLVREVPAKGDLPAWRTEADTGRRFALMLTKTGRALVPEPVGDGEQPAPVPSPAPDPATSSVPTAPRHGSKLAEVITLLGREQGTSVAKLMAATGWLPHTTRAALTGLRKRGYALTRQTGESGSVYRIGSSQAAAA